MQEDQATLVAHAAVVRSELAGHITCATSCILTEKKGRQDGMIVHLGYSEWTQGEHCTMSGTQDVPERSLLLWKDHERMNNFFYLSLAEF